MQKTRELLPVEQEIISLFFPKNKRKRIRYELSKVDLNDPDSFGDFHWRNLHSSNNINLKGLYAEDSCLSESELHNFAGKDPVYYMGLDYYGWLSVNEAFEKAFHESHMCLIYCGNGVAYYQGEHYSKNGIGAAPERYRLSVKKG